MKPTKTKGSKSASTEVRKEQNSSHTLGHTSRNRLEPRAVWISNASMTRVDCARHTNTCCVATVVLLGPCCNTTTLTPIITRAWVEGRVSNACMHAQDHRVWWGRERNAQSEVTCMFIHAITHDTAKHPKVNQNLLTGEFEPRHHMSVTRPSCAHHTYHKRGGRCIQS